MANQPFTTTGDEDDRDAKYGQMVDGDTLIFDPGTHSWTRTWTITKRITVAGQTTITGGGTLNPTIHDNTIITKTFSGSLIVHSPPPTTSNIISTLSGLSLFNGAGGTETNSQGLLNITSSGDHSAPCTNVRINQIHIKATGGSYRLAGWVYGVADQCVCESTSGTSIMSGQGEWNHSTHGNGSYADFPHYGSEKAWFFENCNFIRLGSPSTSTSCNLDAIEGGRCVIRHCYWVACRPGWHGTEGNGTRGGRCYEIYNNTIDWSTNTGPYSSLQRSGSCLYHDNIFLGAKPQQNQHLTMQQYRCNSGVSATMTWGHSGGFSVFDKNVTESDGTSFVEGHTGFVFASGPATVKCGDGTSGPGPGTMTLEVGEQGWQPDQWAPKSGVTNGIGFAVSQNTPSNTSYPKCGIITGNTSHSITFERYGANDRGILLWWDVGHAWKIGKCLRSMDGPGMGRTILYSTPQTANPVIPQAYSQAAEEPCLSWNNVHTPTGTVLNFATSQPSVHISGIHYFNLGGGHPTTGAIPASYTGPAYNSGLNGENYTGTYTYPHPLTAGTIITPTPFIDSQASNSASPFVIGTANSFQVTTQNFSAPPTFALSQILGPGGVITLPGSVTFAGSGPNAGKFTFNGAAGGQGNYNMTITATHLTESTTQAFQLIISSIANLAPSCVITSPNFGDTFSTSDTVTISADAQDDHGIAQVKFFDGAVLLQTVTSIPYTINKVFLQGVHTLTAEATDNGTPPLVTTSAGVTINVNQVPGPPAAPNIAVLGVGAGIPPSPLKEILHWQAGANSGLVSNVVINKTYIDTLPFDGIVVRFPDYQDCLSATYSGTYSTLLSQLSPMNGLLQNVANNYASVLIGNSGMVDPFDDWTTETTRWVNLCRAIIDAGLTGLFFDNEEYNFHLWQYPGDCVHAATKTVSEYQEQYRLIGKQVMTAILAQVPTIKILVTVDPSRSTAAQPSDAIFNGSANWLGGFFALGMFEAAPGKIINGGEHYYSRTSANFQNWKTFMRTTLTQSPSSPPLIPGTLAGIWMDQINQSFGIYDQDTVGTPAMTTSVLTSTLVNAMPFATSFLWNYSESLDWLTPGGGSVGAWQNAVSVARTTLGI